jgi:hypothetical protein
MTLESYRAIVIEEHTLGVIMGNGVQVLHASVIRGSGYTMHPGWISIPQDPSSYRDATKADFDAYRVNWGPIYSVVEG